MKEKTLTFINSTDNQKTWVRIPAQSKTSFLPHKDFKFFKINFYLKLTNNNTFGNVFCNRIFPYFRFLLIF